MKRQKELHTKRQSHKTNEKKQIIQQDNEDFEIKMKKVQREIASLSLDIDYLLEEKKFKDETQKILLKQRKNLENCFLYKNIQKSKQTSDDSTERTLPNNKVKNMFRNVNQRIEEYIKQLEAIKQNQNIPSSEKINEQTQNQSEATIQRLECQSLHLKEIFNPQQTLSHSAKVSKLKTKLSLLYQKIQLNLQREQPYLHQKIVQRIKRQAQSQTRKRLLQQLQVLIKQNSIWMTQQTNLVNNQLEEQKVEQICVNNLEVMKRIMSKKVYNNDWIFQNYGDPKFSKEGNSAFPTQKIKKQYQQILKHLHQKRIADQLWMFKGKSNSEQEKQQDNDLKQLLSYPLINNFLSKENKNGDEFSKSQSELQVTVEKIHNQIEKLIKG